MSTEIATAPAKAPATLRAHLEGDARRAAMMHRSKHFTSLSRPPSSGLTKKPEALTSGQNTEH